MATEKRPTHRRKSRQSSDCWPFADSPSLFSRPAAMRPRLRRFSLARHRPPSFFFLALSSHLGQPRPAQGTSPAMQDRPLQAGRRAVQPGSRSHAQTVLWRRRNALHTAERVAKVLIVGRSPIRLHFFLDTPQCARACGVFLWLATALILSFSSTFLL